MSVKRSWIVAAVVLVVALVYAPMAVGSAVDTVRTSVGIFLVALGIDTH